MSKIGVLPCSGACNLGMMTTKAVVEVCQENDQVGFVCALGLPLGIEGIVAKARAFKKNVAVNGCEVRCASRSLEMVGLPVDHELVLTRDFDLEKSKNFKDERGLEAVVQSLSQAVDRLST
jgi:uncharacterized metal-binding protein